MIIISWLLIISFAGFFAIPAIGLSYFMAKYPLERQPDYAERMRFGLRFLFWCACVISVIILLTISVCIIINNGL